MVLILMLMMKRHPLDSFRLVLYALSGNSESPMSTQLVVAQSAVAVVESRKVPRPFSLLQSSLKVTVEHSARRR
jgi:hypothetical protein